MPSQPMRYLIRIAANPTLEIEIGARDEKEAERRAALIVRSRIDDLNLDDLVAILGPDMAAIGPARSVEQLARQSHAAPKGYAG